MEKKLDRIQGSLIGGAAGDALGYAVEFISDAQIRARYGEGGIQEYALSNGLGLISDDTQMTLFTANGLLVGVTRWKMRGIGGPYTDYIAQAYRDWYTAQQHYFHRVDRKETAYWLMQLPQMYSRRAPGLTCMGAIEDGCRGTIENPINRSKGCGGVMRVAPIGLYFDETWEDSRIDLLGAEAAALTHGHPMGYIPGALLVHIVRYLALREQGTVEEAVKDGLAAMENLFPEEKHLRVFRHMINKALELAREENDDRAAIRSLGEGWCGDEALAIAVYCAAKYQEDFDKALIAAVNHSGDSDSTGAITGNILGAKLGLSRIPEKYLRNLELRGVILEMGEDLYRGCRIDGYSDFTVPENRIWERKYMAAEYTQEG